MWCGEWSFSSLFSLIFSLLSSLFSVSLFLFFLCLFPFSFLLSPFSLLLHLLFLFLLFSPLCREPINQQTSSRSSVIWRTTAAQHKLFNSQHPPTKCTECCHVCDGSPLSSLLIPPSTLLPSTTKEKSQQGFCSITVLLNSKKSLKLKALQI